MLESTHGEWVCKYNHVKNIIGLYTVLKISDIKNFNTVEIPVSPLFEYSTRSIMYIMYIMYVLLFTQCFVAMFIYNILRL